MPARIPARRTRTKTRVAPARRQERTAVATVVFVYGTLMSGETNHGLLARAQFLGVAATRPRFDLVDCGEFPGMVRGGRTAVTGELYAVDAATRAALDRLEEHPRLFRREAVILADGRSAEAYLLPRARAVRLRRIDSGSWRARPA